MIASWLVVALTLLAGYQAGRDKTVPTFWLKTSAQVLTSSDRVRLTCHVPRSDDNRALSMGIQGEAASTFSLDGANAAQTHERWFGPLPGGQQTAYCQVFGSGNEVLHSTTLPLLVQSPD